jgi:hypothetical protein
VMPPETAGSPISTLAQVVMALDSWAEAGAALMKGAAELSQKIMTFSQSRFQAGIDAWQTAATCHSPADLFRERARGKATARYFDDV